MASKELKLANFPGVHKRSRKKWPIVGLILLAAIVAAGVLLAVKWPFTQERVTRELQEATATTVQIGTFKAEYFPHPGCVAEQVTFRQKQGAAGPSMTIHTLVIRGSFWGLFTRHVSLVRAEGAHIALPALGAGLAIGGNNRSGNVIDRLVADGAVLDIQPKIAGGRPTRFLLRRFRLRGLGGDRALWFRTVFENPEPPGEVSASGSFGPWKTGSAASTAVSGSYSFRHADLSVFRGIAGTLSSDGIFSGTFQRLAVKGTTETPDFEAANSGHRFQLSTQFRALVNSTNGDVALQEAAALLGETTIAARGSIAHVKPRQGKRAVLDFSVQNGRIQDLLLLFVKDRRAPLTGVTSFRAHIMIPPGGGAFIRKVKLQGEFGIGGARFTSPSTEKSVSNLSQHAQGKKDENSENPERVLSDLRGQVVVKNGIARFSRLRFSIPGARAQMHGTYNLVNERINLQGLLHINAKLSNATSGIKSFLLKALGPFLKSNHPGEVVPVSITGTYAHPAYHMSPNSKK